MEGAGKMQKKPFVVLDKANNIVFLCKGNEIQVVREELSCRFCDEDVQPALQSVLCDGVVGT